MKLKNKWILVISIILILLFILFFVNSYSAKCDLNHILTNVTIDNKVSQFCVYTPLIASCNEGEVYSNSQCQYSKKGFINNVYFMYLLVILGILLLIYLSIFFYKKYFLKSELKIPKLEHIPMKTARRVFEKAWANEYDMYMYDNAPNKKNFHWLEQEWFLAKNNERIAKCEVTINGCNNILGNGTFTTMLSLSRGEQSILDFDFKLQYIDFSRFVYKPNLFPFYNIQDPRERYLERLAEVEPELYKQELMKEFQPKQQEQTEEEKQKQQVFIVEQKQKEATEAGEQTPSSPIEGELMRRYPHKYRRRF